MALELSEVGSAGCGGPCGPAESLSGAVALLSAVADPVRLSLLWRLAREGTRCVCALQPDPPIPANLLSYHLRVLRDAGLIRGARRGRWIDYTLAPTALERLRDALPHPAGPLAGEAGGRP